MIELRDVRYRYPRSSWVLEGIHVTVAAGTYLAVCGANGSGKSTLGYLLNGLIPHFFAGELSGMVVVHGLDTRRVPVAELCTHVGLVVQNSDAQLFHSTVADDIAFGLENLGLPAAEIDRRLAEVADSLHLEDLLTRSPNTLSGGEKRLAAIATALCLEPPVLVLDEPNAHLDWEGARRVRQALRSIHCRGTTLIVIEQRLDGFLRDVSRCLVLGRGTILDDASPRELHRALAAEQLIPRYRRRRPLRPSATEPLLTVEDLSFRRAEREILKGISLQIRRGEQVALIGKNGSGKTTLIKHFNGLLRPTGGRVRFSGESVRGKSPAAMAAQVGLAFQNANDQFFRYRVRDELLVGPQRLGRGADGSLEALADRFALHGLLDRSPYRLSEGEKKRVALASILAMRPQLLILDEPTVGQDGAAREALALALDGLAEDGLTTLVVTHDLDFAEATADRWVVIDEGRVVADGPAEELRDDAALVAAGAIPGVEERESAAWFPD